MSTKTKIWLITASALILVGCILFGGVMTVLNWDFKKLSTVKYETNEYTVSEKFESISVITDTADIVFVPSENSSVSVVCYEETDAKHLVSVKDGALRVELNNTKKWYGCIGINFGSPKITISLPAGEYGTLSLKGDTGDVEISEKLGFENIEVSVSTGDVSSRASSLGPVKIRTSTGKINVENISVGSLELSVSTGKMLVSDVTCGGDVTVGVTTGKAQFANVTCKNLTSTGNTGDISLKNVIADESFSIKRSTGNVSFESCDASEVSVKTSTGDVCGSFLSPKAVFAESNTGSISIPEEQKGGRCDITTDTGDVEIYIN